MLISVGYKELRVLWICTCYCHKMHSVDTNHCELFFNFVSKGLLLSHCLVLYKLVFIAINIRSNFHPCQHHWYDVYLIKAHFSPPYT